MPSIESLTARYARIASHPEGWVLDGWVDVFDDMLRELEAMLDDTSTLLELVDVKDKLGTLRIRYHPPAGAPDSLRERIRAVIERAEARSARICEVCGRPGSPRADDFGWISTRCAAHE